jgi:hypothetical protein
MSVTCEPVGLVAPEAPFDQVGRRGDVGEPSEPRPPGQSGEPDSLHEQLHRTATDVEPVPRG